MNDFKPGLEGVVAVQTEIAEPDREGGALRYRGIDIEELVGHVPYEKVWGLLVDDDINSEMPHPEPYEPAALSGNAPSDLQAETGRLSGVWRLGKLNEISDEQAREDLGRLSAEMMEIVARSAAVAEGREPAPDDVVAGGDTAAERFLLRWRGEADPRHVTAIDTYWICTAEHGLNASTFTARVVASTGADCGAALSSAVGALSGPLHGGAPARVLPMLDAVAESGDAEKWVAEALARQVGAQALVTGESLGQVASQTLENVARIDEAATMPVFRPLIGTDKLEITAEAQRLGTFEISIEPDADCCTLFTPKHPSTRMSDDGTRAVEAALDIPGLVDAGTAGAKLETFAYPSGEALV